MKEAASAEGDHVVCQAPRKARAISMCALSPGRAPGGARARRPAVCVPPFCTAGRILTQDPDPGAVGARAASRTPSGAR